MIYRYTIGSMACLAGALALFWFTRTPAPVSGSRASQGRTAPAQAGSVPSVAPASSSSKAIPAPPAPPAMSALSLDAVLAQLRAMPTNECTGECERLLRELAGRVEAGA